MDHDDLRPMRAVIWASIASAIGWAILILLLVYLPPGRAASPDLLLVQHAYDGPIEQAGKVKAWRYTPNMLLEWTDTTTDGVFRSGFDA